MSCKDESIAVKNAQVKFDDKATVRDEAQAAVDAAVLALEAAQSDLEIAGAELNTAYSAYVSCVIG